MELLHLYVVVRLNRRHRVGMVVSSHKVQTQRRIMYANMKRFFFIRQKQIVPTVSVTAYDTQFVVRPERTPI